jgi:hypothetical protein
MLIRLENEELIEYPDELGALVLADPREGDVPDFSLDLVNCLIHDTLVTMFDTSRTLEQNIAEAKAYYKNWGNPSDANMEKARALIESYNKNITPEEVGYIDRDLMSYLYFTHDPKNAAQSTIIDQPPKSKAQSALLTDSGSPDENG